MQFFSVLALVGLVAANAIPNNYGECKPKTITKKEIVYKTIYQKQYEHPKTETIYKEKKVWVTKTVEKEKQIYVTKTDTKKETVTTTLVSTATSFFRDSLSFHVLHSLCLS